MKNRSFFFLTLFCIFLLKGIANAETKPITQGTRFPGTTFQNDLSGEERLYVGLQGKTRFSLRDAKGSLFLIEVFSTYCTLCPQNVPVLNSIYSSIGKDPELRGNVKVIAVAVGNTANEVGAFKREYKALYPILTDPLYALHKALGNPRVPYTILSMRSSKGDVVVYIHQGVIESSDDVLNKIKGFLFH